MFHTLRATIGPEKTLLPLEEVDLPEGAEVLITILTDTEKHFWQSASSIHLEKIWNNDEDDVYEKLL